MRIFKIYRTATQALKENPAYFAPFIIFACIEFLTLIIIFLTPRMPFVLLFGPPVRTLWGERFLHYPLNFLLLPKMASLSRMFLTVIFGSLFSGMAVAIVSAIYGKKTINLKQALNSALKKYVSLFAIVLIFSSLFYLLNKIITMGLAKYFISGHSKLLFLGAGIWLGPLSSVLNFILAAFIQAAFVYSIPLLIISEEKIIGAVLKSFILFKRYFLLTLTLVLLPMLLYVPVIILIYHSSFLIMSFSPELILLILIAGIIVNSLVVDPLITITTTLLFLEDKNK